MLCIYDEQTQQLKRFIVSEHGQTIKSADTQEFDDMPWVLLSAFLYYAKLFNQTVYYVD